MENNNNNITFDEYQYKSRSVLGQSESPAMIRFLVKNRVVKDEKQALGFMFIVTGLFISATIFIVYINFFKTTAVPPLTAEQELLFNQQQDQVNRVNK